MVILKVLVPLDMWGNFIGNAMQGLKSMSRRPRILLVIAFLLALFSGPQQLFATEITPPPGASAGVEMDCNEDPLQHADACCNAATWVSPAHEDVHVLSVSSAEPLPMMVIEAPPLEISTELYRPPRNA